MHARPPATLVALPLTGSLPCVPPCRRASVAERCAGDALFLLYAARVRISHPCCVACMRQCTDVVWEAQPAPFPCVIVCMHAGMRTTDTVQLTFRPSSKLPLNTSSPSMCAYADMVELNLPSNITINVPGVRVVPDPGFSPRLGDFHTLFVVHGHDISFMALMGDAASPPHLPPRLLCVQRARRS